MFLFRKQHIDPDEFLKRENNNFDLIRLVGAIAVIFSHTYAIAWVDFGADPLQSFSHYKLAVGVPFLYMFFFLSGFLVSRSFINRKSTWEYLQKRGLRILPAILVMVPLLMLVIGPIFNELSPLEYYSQRHTWGFLRNISLYWLQPTLPGIFAENPDPYLANTNLWTIALEVTWYGLTALMGILAIFRHRWALISLFFICYGTMLIATDWMVSVDIPLLGIELKPFIRVGIYYSAGMVFYSYRAFFLRLNPVILLFLTPLWFVSIAYDLSDWTTPLFIPIFTILIATIPLLWSKKVTRLGDPSYGMYIWGVPLQQMVVAMFGTNWFVAFFVTILLAYLLGLASWWWVEKPALGLRSKDLFLWLGKSHDRV
ncbi:MAG TPA: acyltransferase [Bacteroidetes bacterium]|nr:acyltransferase [Bacteroidota bacterium]